MGKRKRQNTAAAPSGLETQLAGLSIQDPSTPTRANAARRKVPIEDKWSEYFGAGDLADWQRLCHDVGLQGDFSSKTKCRKALRGVWVNICDFLKAVRKPEDVHRFQSERQLAAYTRKSGKVYPRGKVDQHSPLRVLLAHIF